MRTVRSLVAVIAVAAVLLLWALIFPELGRAATVRGGPPIKIPPVRLWATCKPQATIRIGEYRIDNDAPFAGLKGTECIYGTPPTVTFTIAGTLQGQDGIVVGYPNVRYGPKFGSRDAGSVLPSKVGRLGRFTAHVTTAGTAAGHWLTDVDAWVYPDANTRQHGTAEIVIGVQWKGWQAGAMPARIGGRSYLVSRWMTGSGGESWPLTVFRPLRRGGSRALRLGAFTRFMLRRHWLSPRDYLGNVAMGTEIWAGGAGLTDGMTVTG